MNIQCQRESAKKKQFHNLDHVMALLYQLLKKM